jgi:hypothetical protein
MATIGVPIKVLHEAEGHVVTVETTTGEVSWDKLTSGRIRIRTQIGGNVSLGTVLYRKYKPADTRISSVLVSCSVWDLYSFDTDPDPAF